MSARDAATNDPPPPLIRPSGHLSDLRSPPRHGCADVVASNGVDAADRAPSLDRQIWRLAGPAALTLAAEPLYLLADTAVVGRIGVDALGGLAVASSILLFCTGALIFLTFGTAATVARLIGAGDPDEAAEQSVQGLWLGFGLGAILAVALAVLGPWLVGLFATTDAVAHNALVYLHVSLIGLPATCVMMAGTGALRGHLDTRTPLVVMVASNAVNIGLEVALVFGAGWGLAGSAAGTVVAQWGAAIAYVVMVLRMASAQGVGRRPHAGRIRHLAVIGRDLFVRTIALRSAFTLSTLLAARRGTTALAAYQIAIQWWVFLTYLLDALEAAAQSLVGRALGAVNRPLARATATRILWWACGLGVVLGAATIVFRGAIAHLFTNQADIRSMLLGSLIWVGVLQPINGLASSLDGILVGAGDLRFLAGAMLVSTVILAIGGTITTIADTALWGLWLALGVFMASRVILLGWRFLTPRWERTGAAIRS